MNPTRIAACAATLALLLAAPAAASAQVAPLPRSAASAAAPGDAGSASCARQWRAYRRSAACYARFRTVHGIKAEAAQRCGPPLKEPVDCPRP